MALLCLSSVCGEMVKNLSLMSPASIEAHAVYSPDSPVLNYAVSESHSILGQR